MSIESDTWVLLLKCNYAHKYIPNIYSADGMQHYIKTQFNNWHIVWLRIWPLTVIALI